MLPVWTVDLYSGEKRDPAPPKWTMTIARRKTKKHICTSCIGASKTGRTAVRVQGCVVKLLSLVLAAFVMHLLFWADLWFSEVPLVNAFFLIHFQAGCLLHHPFIVSCVCGGCSNFSFQCLPSWGGCLGYFPHAYHRSLCWSYVRLKQVLVWLLHCFLFCFLPCSPNLSSQLSATSVIFPPQN